MTYQRETAYQRAVKTLAREARHSGKWPAQPDFGQSEVRSNLVILRDQSGAVIASFRVTERGLKLID